MTKMLYQYRIYYLSYRLQLSRKELAAKAGMTTGELNRIMSSEAPNITIEQTAKLAIALETTMNYLISGQ